MNSAVNRILPLAFCLAASSVSGGATRNVPSDYATIQAAIDAADPGDMILVQPGVYPERLVLRPGLTLRSAGDETAGELGLQRAESTIIDGAMPESDAPGVLMAAGCTLDGFTITGVGAYDDQRWNAHHATQGEEQSHEVIGVPGVPGIFVKGVECTIRNNIVHHNGHTGIVIQAAANVGCSPLVADNICYRNMGGGIGSLDHSTAVIRGNRCFENFLAGVGHDNASPVVTNNVCYGNIRAGIGISNEARPIVRGNRCYENRRAGVGIRSPGTSPIIEGNECHDNGMAGIGIREGAAPIVRRNRCYRNHLAGIGARTRSRPIIIENECFENRLAGIGQQSDAVTMLVGNHCHDNLAAGIGFDECVEGVSSVMNNRVVDNAMVAVGIHAGWTVHLSGNELTRPEGLPPVVMVFEGAEAILTHNVLRGGGVAAIRVGGRISATHNQLLGTAVRTGGPPNFGVWVLPGGEAHIAHNDIREWRHAVYANGGRVTVANNLVSHFHETAFQINEPVEPCRVYGNLVHAAGPEDRITSLPNDAGEIWGNELRYEGNPPSAAPGQD